MAWEVVWDNSAYDDLRWFHLVDQRFIYERAMEFLSQSPLAETKNLKTLRPNPVAQRELRLRGNVRILFDVDGVANEVKVLSVGEKRGSKLFVRGQEFTKHL